MPPMFALICTACGKFASEEVDAQFAVLPDGKEIKLEHPCEAFHINKLAKEYPTWGGESITKQSYVCPSCFGITWMAKSSGECSACKKPLVLLDLGREPGRKTVKDVRCGCGSMAKIVFFGYS